MIWVVISAVLFGLVHPGSKFIMDQGINLLPFCLLYVGVRLIAQIPLVLKGSQWKIKSKGEFFSLLSLGVVGAGLQYSEFAGISNGIPVPLVTFLVYTHPVWTLLLGRFFGNEPFTFATALKLVLAIVGIVFITGAKWDAGYSLQALMFPIIAGLMISLWITLSNVAVKKGASSRTVSFYYDLFAFSLLCTLGVSSQGTPIAEAIHFMGTSPHALQIVFYSVVIGLIPNCLFYYGSSSVSAVTAGFVLLLEPVIAAGTSSLIWGEVLSPFFLIGALCILATNLPSSVFLLIQSGFRNFYFHITNEPVRFAGALGLFLVTPLLMGIASIPKTVQLVEIVPTNPTDYTSVREMKQMESATDMAVRDYKKVEPSCEVKVIRTLKRGSEEELFSTVHTIALTSPESILLGISTTNAARVGAKAALGTKLQGISIGASGIDFKQANSNFISVVSPWTRQWDAIFAKMSELGCKNANTLVIADPKNRMSTNFLKLASKTLQVLSVTEISPEETSKQATDKKCVFFALSYSESEKYLSKLIKSQWNGSVFGTGDWNYYSEELTKTLESAHYEGLTTYAPTGWKVNASIRSQAFSTRFKESNGESASPVAAYAYDGMLLALDKLCHPHASLRNRFHTVPFLRNFEGIAESGNLLSEMFLVRRESRNSYAKK